MMDLFDILLGRPVTLRIKEDNQATIKILKKGYSPKLRHVLRHHKVNLGSVKEVLDQGNVELEYIPSEEQRADIFTKALPPNKWPHALEMLGISTAPTPASGATVTNAAATPNKAQDGASDAPLVPGILAA